MKQPATGAPRAMRNAICFLWGFSGVTAFAIVAEAVSRVVR